MNTKRILILIVLLMLAAIGGGFFWHSSPAKQPSDLTTITLGYRPTVVVDLALLIGVEQGEFRRAGFDVHLKPFGRADLLLSALRSGEIQGSVGIPLEPLISLASKKEYPVVGYLVWYFDEEVAYDGFVVRSDSPVRTLEDLESKTVGSHPSKQVQYFVSRILPKATIQEYNPAAPLVGLESGDQAAAYVLEPAISQAITSGKFRLLESGSISRRVFQGLRVPAAVSVLSSDWVALHKTQADRFVTLAQKLQSEFSETRQRTEIVKLLGKKEYGLYSEAVASRVVEPASSLPSVIDRIALDRFSTELGKGNLVDGKIDFSKILYIKE